MPDKEVKWLALHLAFFDSLDGATGTQLFLGQVRAAIRVSIEQWLDTRNPLLDLRHLSDNRRL